jgi:hypothetical protein
MKFSEEEKAMWLEDWGRSGKSAWAYAKAKYPLKLTLLPPDKKLK